MEFTGWFWDTAIGIAGIAVMFMFIMMGTKKKGVPGHVLNFLGVILGGVLLAFALDRTIFDKFF